MSEQTFEERVARVKEHLLEPTPEEALDEAERCLARGDESFARLHLAIAQSRQGTLERKERDRERDRVAEEEDWEDEGDA